MKGNFFLFNDENRVLDDRSDDKLFTRGLFGDIVMGGCSTGSNRSSEIIEEEEEENCSSSSESNSSFNGWERLRVRLRIPATIREEIHEEEGSGNSSEFGGKGGNDVYVAVGKSKSSVEALRWALKNLMMMKSNSLLYLIHVFPEIRFIPSPLGRLPKDKVNPEQVKNYMEVENEKRLQLIQKFKNLCSVYKIKVTDTHLIESDDIANAIVDLTLILNIKQLVLGTTKPTLRKVSRANGIANQIRKKVFDTCEVRVVCDGKEVIDDGDPTSINGQGSSISRKSNVGSLSSRRSSTSSSSNSTEDIQTQQYENPSDLSSFNPTCTCFSMATKFIQH